MTNPEPGVVPPEIVDLMPRYIEDLDVDDEDSDCYMAHSVTWGPNLKGACADCKAEFTPDDIQLRGNVRERVEAAAAAAGLVTGAGYGAAEPDKVGRPA